MHPPSHPMPRRRRLLCLTLGGCAWPFYAPYKGVPGIYYVPTLSRWKPIRMLVYATCRCRLIHAKRENILTLRPNFSVLFSVVQTEGGQSTIGLDWFPLVFM